MVNTAHGSKQPASRAAALALAGLLGFAGNLFATEEAKYTVIIADGPFELRDYAPRLLAETVVAGEFETAGSRAFSRLFGYISGDNRARQEIAMTAPVSQQETSAEIAMTAPVSQEPAADGRWRVGFMMPAEYTAETIPQPTDPAVTLRALPAMRMAAVRYSGFWSEKSYAEQLAALQDWLQQQGLTAAGDPTWARYNPPFTPWFLRRNEILIPVEAAPGTG